MSVFPSDNAACAEMEDRFLYMQARMAGLLDGERVIAEGVDECRQGLIEDIRNVSSILRNRQQAAETTLVGFQQELESIESFSAEKIQVENLQDTLHGLQKGVDSLQKIFLSTQEELIQKSHEHKFLQASLRSLRATLISGRGQHYSFQDPLRGVGTLTCCNISGIKIGTII